MKELKAALQDYFENFFSLTAPVKRGDYLRMGIILYYLIFIPIIIVYFLFFQRVDYEIYYKMSKAAQHQYDIDYSIKLSILLFITWLTIFFLNFTRDMRAFNTRNKTPMLYLISSILSLMIVLGTIIYCKLTNSIVPMGPLFLFLIICYIPTLANQFGIWPDDPKFQPNISNN